MIRVHRLRPDNTIGVFSPSEPITDRRRSRLEQGIGVLEHHGFRVRISRNCLAQHAYMAGTVMQRLEDIHSLLRDDGVHALMTSWGGKSCSQLPAHLDYGLIKERRKAFIGFSDGCVLANAITAKTGLVTFNGPNVVGKLHETEHADLRLLSDSDPCLGLNLLGDPERVSARVLRPGIADGLLVGGNLSTFVLGLLGSQYLPDARGAVFFWESGGESPQIVHQFLQCLRNAGFFSRLAGMVIGDFIREDPDDYKRLDALAVVADMMSTYSFPILYCPTFGHPPGLQNPLLPIGAPVQLDAAAAALRLLEPVTT